MSDWRIVKWDQTNMSDGAWRADRQVTALGVYYLVDFARHVHICSLTPALEMWPMHAYVEFETLESCERDEGALEMEVLNAEEACCYVDVSTAARWSSVPLKSVPDRECDETDESYYLRVIEETREYLAGNPVCF